MVRAGMIIHTDIQDVITIDKHKFLPHVVCTALVEKQRLDMFYPTGFQEVTVVDCDQFLLQC